MRNDEQLMLLRKQIEDVDEQMVALWEKRLSIAIKIGECKCAQNLPVYDPQREDALWETWQNALSDKSLAFGLKTFFSAAVAAAKDVQKK